MKKISILFIGLLLIPSLFFTSCDRGDDPTDSPIISTPKFTLLKDYMVQSNLDIDQILTNTDGEKFVVGPPASSDLVDGFLSSYYIMDIRNNTDFLTAHVNGAKNVAFTNILTDASNATKPILIICYTGQTACYATALLRMYGYPHTQALKWGMSGWNATFDKWTANCKDLTTADNWTTDATAAGSFSAPAWSSTTTDGAALLKERVEATVAAGFKTASNADVLANPANYYINNFFSDAHYTGFGHVKGAVRVSPLTIDLFDGLDPAKEVVTYCYTGQTSAVITAYLNVVGFNAKSLTFGMNGMSVSNSFWTAGEGVTNHWGFDSKPKDLPTVSN